MEYKYRVSVIVPVYNQEPFLEKCVNSLIKQTIPASDMEILLIDDGSTDASVQMCDNYASKYENIHVVHKINGGLSDARNCGIDNASGKYLMFVDGDDYLHNDTVLPVVDFFDKHYDEVDLVTYPSITLKDGEELAPHYRYRTFCATGIYDLSLPENIYAGVTRIEVCTKNLGKESVRFSSDRTFRHEDQKYCTDVILPKLKVGFCNRGAYYYEQQPSGLQRTKFHAYYIFENTIGFWEEEFAKYEGEVPKYLQALFVSDIAWKINASILYPHHYKDEAYVRALNRIKQLLSRVELGVLIRHPALDEYQVAYMLQLMDKDVRCVCQGGFVSLMVDNLVAFAQKDIQLTLLRTIPRQDGMALMGYLKSPCFQFMGKPRLTARVAIDGAMHTEDVPLARSSWSYYQSKEPVSQFWGFTFSLSVEQQGSVDFFIELDGCKINLDYYFSTRAIFSDIGVVRSQFVFGNNEYWFKNNTFTVRRLSSQQAKAVQKKVDTAFLPKGDRVLRRAARALQNTGRRIWLYHDCHGVEKNNAYYQYMYDIEQSDGVERYYVVNDSLDSKKHLFTSEQMKNVIRFRSTKHKALFLAAEKIITAYVETTNYMPTKPEVFKEFSDIFCAEIVYLQHGVLHAHQPWKYSLDRLLIDKEVVSTGFELQNLTEHYCFNSRNLICAGMPRYDFIDTDTAPKKKILYAPSWRKYLVSQKPDGQWEPVHNTFLQSDFYKETKAFLESPKLHELLTTYGYQLDFKLHPILEELYKQHYCLQSSLVSLAPSSVIDTDYAVFITDFSSYRFDFVYLKRAVAYFFPDLEMFESGMCDYRELDLPLDGQFGNLATTGEAMLDILDEILRNNGEPKVAFKQQMEDFFLHYDNNQRKRIYEALIGRE